MAANPTTCLPILNVSAVPPVNKVNPGNPDLPVPKAPLAHKVSRVPPAFRVLRDLPGKMVSTVHRVLLVPKVLLVRKAQKETKVIPECQLFPCLV